MSSETFDIEKFSQTAGQLMETLEKANSYIRDVDQAMARIYKETQQEKLDTMLEEYGKRLDSLNESCQKAVDTLAGQPREMAETAAKLAEAVQQFGDAGARMDEFRKSGEHLGQLMDSLGNLGSFEERLKSYEAELGRASGILATIREQQADIQNLPEVLREMKESVADLQKQYVESALDMKGQGKAAQKGVQSIVASVERAIGLRQEFSKQADFFKIGISSLIVMNALMLMFLFVFLVKEIFF